MHSPPTDPTSPRKGLAQRAKLVRQGLFLALIVTLAAALVADYLRWRGVRDDLSGRLLAAGPRVEVAEPLQRIQRERTSLHSKVVTIRALVNGASRLDTTGTVPDEERIRLLDEAGTLAQRVLEEHPANWEASMLLGTAVYVRRSITADRRLITEPSAWEEPIEHAIAMAPGKVEPKRMLAAFYLETWSYLSSDKQQRARELLRSVFELEPESLQRLAPHWLQLVGSRGDALDIFPDRPETWIFLRVHLAKLREWSAVVRVYQRGLDALERQLRLDLDEAEERIARGDILTGRRLCLSVLTTAPPGLRFAPLVERALAIQPPGIHGLGSTDPLQDWLHFLLRMDLLGLSAAGAGHGEDHGEDHGDGHREDADGAETRGVVLTPSAVRRLYDAAGTLEAPVAAHIALLGEDFYTLGRLTESLQTHMTSEWGMFLAAWAHRQLLVEGPEVAAKTLARASALSKASLSVLVVQQQVALAEGDEETLARVTEALAEHRQAKWTAFDWHYDHGLAWLDLLPAERARGLRIEIAEAEVGGDVVDFFWDGERLGTYPVGPGSELELELEIDPRLHLFELRSVRGMRLAPGRLELIP